MFKIAEDDDPLEFNTEMATMFRAEVAAVMTSAIKDRLENDILPGLMPKNFFGEAMDYLHDHSLEQTDAAILEQATLMLEDFKANIDVQVYLDEDSNIFLSAIAGACEFGDLYNGPMKLITKSLEISSSENMK